MPNYICPRCKYQTNRKSSIYKHFTRTTICEPKNIDISIEECKKMLSNGEIRTAIKRNIEKIEHICEHCNKKFNRKQRLDNHLLKCNKKEDIIKQMQKQIQKLEEKLEEKLEDKQTISNTNITNNTDNSTTDNSTTNITNYITINSYKNTDYKAVEQALTTCIKRNGEIDMKKLIEAVHFNENAPQNHNVYIANSKTRRVMKYDGKDFIEDGRGDKGLENLFNEKLGDIEEDQQLDDNIKFAGEETWLSFNNKNKEQRKEIFEDIYKPLYNKRNKVIESN